LGILVPVACVCVAFAVVATVFFRRQWTRAEARRLHLTVKLSGLATDEEVFIYLFIYLFILKLSVHICKTVGSHGIIAGTNTQTYTRVPVWT